MKTPDEPQAENSSSPENHSANIRCRLGELIDQLTADMARVNDPNFRSLLEVSAEVLKGVRTAYAHYDPMQAQSRSLSQ